MVAREADRFVGAGVRARVVAVPTVEHATHLQGEDLARRITRQAADAERLVELRACLGVAAAEGTNVRGREGAAADRGGGAGGGADLDGAARIVGGGAEVLGPHGGEAGPRQRRGRGGPIARLLGEREPPLTLGPALVEVADEERVRRLRLVDSHAGGDG